MRVCKNRAKYKIPCVWLLAMTWEWEIGGGAGAVRGRHVMTRELSPHVACPCIEERSGQCQDTWCSRAHSADNAAAPGDLTSGPGTVWWSLQQRTELLALQCSAALSLPAVWAPHVLLTTCSLQWRYLWKLQHRIWTLSSSSAGAASSP